MSVTRRWQSSSSADPPPASRTGHRRLSPARSRLHRPATFPKPGLTLRTAVAARRIGECEFTSTCAALQRPFDDKTQLRVLVEAEAVLGVLALCESGQADLIASDALAFENDANPDAVRRDFANQALATATQFVQTDDPLKALAQTFVDSGIKPLDALHLASAIQAQAEFFCTCDDRLLKKARSLNTAPTKVVSPLELVSELQP